MLEDKIALIDKICKLHPSLGVEEDWSNYTGGMKDSGDWNFRKMLDVPIEDLQEFYDDQILKQTGWIISQNKLKEDFKSSGLTQNEWDAKRWRDLIDQLNKQQADLLFESINKGASVKPKED